MDKKMNNLLEEQLGYEVIDALVQANVDLRSVSLEEAKELILRAGREHRREAVDGGFAPAR